MGLWDQPVPPGASVVVQTRSACGWGADPRTAPQQGFQGKGVQKVVTWLGEKPQLGVQHL